MPLPNQASHRDRRDDMATLARSILAEPVLLTDAEMDGVAGGFSILASLLGCPKSGRLENSMDLKDEEGDTGTCPTEHDEVDTGTCPPA
jgi:hypothetical protein